MELIDAQRWADSCDYWRKSATRRYRGNPNPENRRYMDRSREAYRQAKRDWEAMVATAISR